MRHINEKMKRILLLLIICCAGFLDAGEIALVTIATGDQYKELVRLGIENKSAYCQNHGYDFIYSEESEDTSRHIYWSKILLMLKVLENPAYEWAVWIDADTLIMNTDIPLEDIIDDNYRFIITKGWNGINSGVFFIKNCDWSKEFLKNVYARTDCINTIWPEQIAIAEELEKPENSPFAKIVPNRLFNSFPADISPPHSSCFNSGDFIAHFAGVGRSTWLAALFDKYVTQVVHDRTLITLDFFLGIHGFNLSPTHSTNNEGYMSNEQSKQFQDRLALHPNIESIMEIGLNGGHSADNFFRTCKNLKKFVSFDISMHPYTPVAVEYFRRTHKEIFEFVQGDSTVTVPKYAQQSPDTKFDLIYIDGGHSYEICYIDLLNCKKLAHPKTLVWIDDFNAPNIAWAIRDLQNIGVLELLDVHSSWGPDGMRVWAELRYLP